MARRSGIQSEVLSLYRRAIRMAYSKPQNVQPKFLVFVRYTFRQQAATVTKRDVAAIEHLLRRGRRQIQQFEDPSVKDCFVSQEMEEWARVNGLGQQIRTKSRVE